MSCGSTNASRSPPPLLLLQFHLSKEKIVVVVDIADIVGAVGAVGAVDLGVHDVDLGVHDVGLGAHDDRVGLDDLGDGGDLGVHDVGLGGDVHGDHVGLGEFDKEQPADVYDGGRGDVLVVDDVHDGHGDLGGDGVHDGHGDLGGDDVHDGHGDLDDGVHDDRRGGHGDRKTLWITTYSACHNTYSRYRKSCLYSSNERWECSWYAYWYSSGRSAYKCWDSCLCSSY